jgi:microcin C transport system permease protein
MTAYFIRRFLLIIPTFIGITLITFLILQFVPGGPLEMQLLKMKFGGRGPGESGQTMGNMQNIPETAVEELKKFYGFDKPIHIRYITWVSNLVQLNI